MSVISSIKKAFGFADEYDEDDIDRMIERESSAESHSSEALNHDTVSSADDTSPEQNLNELPGEIFDAVIELFNATQPEFVRECLNQDDQRRYLMTRIDSSLRQKLKTQTEAAIEHGRQQWIDEKRRMAQEVEKLKSDYHSLKQQREEFQNAQLSASRQKRALTDRIHDLENQVNTLEAEKEQYQLENRSMLNKLRVANVKNSSDDPEAEERLQSLAQENVTLQDSLKEATEKISTLSEQLSKAQEQRSDELSPEYQAMMEEMEQQLEKFEDIKKAKDAKIAELNSQLKESKAKVQEADSEIQSLRETIKTNLHSHATAQAAMQDEIKRLTEMIETQSQTYEEAPEPTKVEEPEITETTDDEPVIISAIDELMDSTDWFQAPEPTPLKKDPALEEEFGYKEPVKKPSSHHDDDKQLSLW